MWTGSEWIPTPPDSETEVPESLNRVEKDDSHSHPYHISADNNSKYKVAGIFLSILSFFPLHWFKFTIFDSVSRFRTSLV